MKIIRCKPGHAIHIDLKTSVDPAMPVDYLFSHSGIDIFIGQMTGQEVKIALQAPKDFNITHDKQLT